MYQLFRRLPLKQTSRCKYLLRQFINELAYIPCEHPAFSSHIDKFMNELIHLVTGELIMRVKHKSFDFAPFFNDNMQVIELINKICKLISDTSRLPRFQNNSRIQHYCNHLLWYATTCYYQVVDCLMLKLLTQHQVQTGALKSAIDCVLRYADHAMICLKLTVPKNSEQHVHIDIRHAQFATISYDFESLVNYQRALSLRKWCEKKVAQLLTYPFNYQTPAMAAHAALHHMCYVTTQRVHLTALQHQRVLTWHYPTRQRQQANDQKLSQRSAQCAQEQRRHIKLKQT